MPGPEPHSITLSESIPKSLYELLAHEIALRSTRARLLGSLDASRRQLGELKNTRSPFSILQRAEVRREMQSSLASAQETIALLEKDLARLDRLEPRLNAFLAHRLEAYLRRSSADYVNCLLEKRHPGDWARVLAQFEHRSTTLQSRLALLAAALESLPAAQTIAGHLQCNLLLSQTLQAAELFEADIAFINKIAGAQCRRTGYGGYTLHRQLELDWTGAFASLATEDGRSAPPALRELARRWQDLAANARRAVQDECPPGDLAAQEDTPGFHARHGNLLREAVALRLDTETRDALARETESLLETGRIAELAGGREELDPKPASLAAKNTPPPPVKAAPPPALKREPEPVLQLRTRRAGAQPAAPAAPPEPAGDSRLSEPDAAALKAGLEKEIARLRTELASAPEQRAEDLVAMEKRPRSPCPQGMNSPSGATPAKPAFDEFNE